MKGPVILKVESFLSTLFEAGPVILALTPSISDLFGAGLLILGTDSLYQ
ncbi:hypothetical protein [Mesobacillus campisalis]|nr:hypothetical protein [Mesobacillus campisalis]